MVKVPGIIRALREMFIWCFVLTIILIMVSTKITSIKKKYTELHKQVNQNRLEIKGLWEQLLK